MSDLPSRLNAALEGRYRIERELGAGGMATVYLADDLRHDRRVALKVLKSELAAIMGAQRFLAEIRTTANLQHPHILPLFDSGEADGFLWYAMPYVAGDTLRDRLDREGQLPVEEGVRIATAVGTALDYAHRHGVVHRDIKPANILLQDGQPVVADFGIALAVQQAGGGRLTETGLSLGTPYYMSPEQATGDRTPDARSDVYALACVLFEMLAGEPPFTGGSAQAVLGRILTSETPRVTEHRKSVPPNVEAVLLRGLEKLPADRFESAAAFGAALSDPGFRHSASAFHGGRRSRIVNGPVLVATAVAVALGGLWLFERVQPPPPRPVHRFSINVNEPWIPGVAVSRDGSMLAYRDTARRVWVRDLRGMEERLLAETPTLDVPVFSPDGSEILFYADQNYDLKVIPLDLRPGRTLHDDAWNDERSLGSAWTAAGEVVIIEPDAIRRASDRGGEWETVREAADGELFRNMSPLPGGEQVLVDRRTRSVEGTVGRLDLETGAFEPILQGWDGRYADGFLFFIQGETLMATSYDPRASRAGEPMVVAEGVGIGRFDVSDSGVLVYQTSGPPTAPGLEIRSTKGERTRLDEALPADVRPVQVRISPDGTAMAYDDGEKIWLQPRSGGAPQRLGRADEEVFNPRWGPDSRYVYFLPSGSRDSGVLYRQRADLTRPPEAVLETPRRIYDLALHPDGRTVALVFENAVEDGDLGVADLETGEWSYLEGAGEGDEHAPTLSPDGRWLAYQTNDEGAYEIYVRPFPGPGSREQASVDGGHSPLWGRSGDELFYLDQFDQLVSLRMETDSVLDIRARSTLFNARSNIPILIWRYRTAYSEDGRGGFIFPDAGAPTPGEMVVVLNVGEELRGRAQGGG
jgi:serine/threonine-protein kinase